MKIRPVETELFREDGRTDRCDGAISGFFHKSANAPKNGRTATCYVRSAQLVMLVGFSGQTAYMCDLEIMPPLCVNGIWSWP
jgi:hypothetical protein